MVSLRQKREGNGKKCVGYGGNVGHADRRGLLDRTSL